MSYTKGPLSIEEVDDCNDWAIYDSEGYYRGQVDNKDDATLFSLSSELLEELQDCREYCYMAIKRHEDEYGRHPATESDRKGMVDDLARYDELIAKATGKS